MLFLIFEFKSAQTNLKLKNHPILTHVFGFTRWNKSLNQLTNLNARNPNSNILQPDVQIHSDFNPFKPKLALKWSIV